MTANPVGLKGGCFLVGTMVRTDHGDVPIEKIKAGDIIYTRPDSNDTKATVSSLAATTEVKPVLSTSNHKVSWLTPRVKL